MIIAFPRETQSGETRISVTPAAIAKYIKSGITVLVEKGLGETVNLNDQDFKEAGAQIISDRDKMLSQADIILRMHKPDPKELDKMKPGSVYISHLDPYNEQALIKKLAAKKITSISMEMIPRTTRAQKMDALSSQSSLAGYAAVIEAARHSDRIFPMMMTPAGTITPASVFIIGAGVAGLQAIATAKRLGAKVEAFDTRPVVEEQVQSLGARFLKIDLGDTGQTKDGYAKELTPAQLKKQQEAMAKRIAQADVVITTAKLFGRQSPIIITKDMIEAMRPGSIIVDLAAETGGNTEGIKPGQVTQYKGVTLMAYKDMASHVPVNASEMYASNLYNLVTEYWNKESKQFHLDPADEIVQGCVITRDGEIVNDRIKALLAKGK